MNKLACVAKYEQNSLMAKYEQNSLCGKISLCGEI
jgi:hypothetical protein